MMFTGTAPLLNGTGNPARTRQYPGLKAFLRWLMTQFATVMMICWGVLVVITGALVLYRARLQGNEMDLVSLDDTFAKENAENQAIAAKVNKVQPAIRILNWVLLVATIFVAGYWIWDFVKQFK